MKFRLNGDTGRHILQGDDDIDFRTVPATGAVAGGGVEKGIVPNGTYLDIK